MGAGGAEGRLEGGRPLHAPCLKAMLHLQSAQDTDLHGQQLMWQLHQGRVTEARMQVQPLASCCPRQLLLKVGLHVQTLLWPVAHVAMTGCCMAR